MVWAVVVMEPKIHSVDKSWGPAVEANYDEFWFPELSMREQ